MERTARLCRTTSWNLGYLAEEHVRAEHARLRLTRAAKAGAAGVRTCPNGSGARREDYSPHGNAWESFLTITRSRACRWGRTARICDRQCRVALALTLWNEHDPILKERLFGLWPRAATARTSRALLLPRRHADGVLPEGAPQVSAGGVPVLLDRGREPAADESRSRVRGPRHRCLRRQPLLRRAGGVREGFETSCSG
jgi:hypothetical protein